MARKRGSNHRRRRQRVNTYNANRRLLRDRWTYTNLNKLIEDRRTWHPDIARPALDFLSSRHRLTLSNLKSKNKNVTRPSRKLNLYQAITSPLAFTNNRVLICVRRKTRREVLHALKRTRKGAGSKMRRRNEFTNIHC